MALLLFLRPWTSGPYPNHAPSAANGRTNAGFGLWTSSLRDHVNWWKVVQSERIHSLWAQNPLYIHISMGFFWVKKCITFYFVAVVITLFPWVFLECKVYMYNNMLRVCLNVKLGIQLKIVSIRCSTYNTERSQSFNSGEKSLGESH